MTNVWDLLASRRLYNSFGLARPYILGSGRAELLVNGHPISDTTYDLNSLPISAIERIEVFSGSGTALHSGDSIAGEINIILRRDFEGIEVQLHGERPTDPGADTEHVSSLWGGAIGAGHITIGVDAFYRDNILDADRDHTRSTWTEGSSFATSSNVSFGGNTVFVPVTTNASNSLIAAPLGECPDNLYTGVLARPRSLPGSGCGFPYGNYQWSLGWRNRESAFLNFEHPLGEASDMYVDARWSDTDYMSRMAPSVGTIELPRDTLLPYDENGQTILEEVLKEISGITLPTDGNIFVAHRFLGHGNRDSRVDIEDYHLTLGLKGQFVSGISYDTQIRYYRHDNIRKAGTYVSENAFKEAITNGHYDLRDPLSQEPNHLNAIRETGLHLTKDYITNHKKVQATLSGTAFKLDGGDSLWTAGAEFVDEDSRDIYDYRDGNNNPLVDESDVIIGSAGNSYAGKRRRSSAHARLSLPLRRNWDVVVAGWHDDYHDVGTKFSHQISSGFRFNENLTVRGSWSKGGSPPSLYALHHEKSLDYPYICDTINLDPNNDCVEYQVQRENISNPSLKPDDSESVSLGFVKNLSMFSLSADWFRIKLSNTPVSLPAQMIVDLKKSGQLPANADVILGDGNRISIIKSPIYNSGASVVSGVNVRAQTDWQTDWADMDFEVRWFHLMQPKSYVASVPNSYDTPSERVHATLLANRDNLTASWNVSFVSGYWNTRETYRYKSWIGHDVTLRWKNAFGKENVDLTTGILNVGDRGPATDPTRPGADGAVSTLDSLRGRTIFLTTKMSF